MVLIEQDIKAITKSGPGVYYVVTELPKNANVVFSDVGNYFYRFQVCNNKKRIQEGINIREKKYKIFDSS